MTPKPLLSDIAFGSGRKRARYHHSRPLYPGHLRGSRTRPNTEHQHEAPSAPDLLATHHRIGSIPRHVFRGHPTLSPMPPRQRLPARHLLSKPESSELTPIETIFSLTPYHHAEDLTLQNLAVSRIETLQKARVSVATSAHSVLALISGPRFNHRALWSIPTPQCSTQSINDGARAVVFKRATSIFRTVFQPPTGGGRASNG